MSLCYDDIVQPQKSAGVLFESRGVQLDMIRFPRNDETGEPNRDRSVDAVCSVVVYHGRCRITKVVMGRTKKETGRWKCR